MTVLALVLLAVFHNRECGATVRPVVTFIPNWSEILYHDPVTVTCDVGSAAPENQRYYWYKDEKHITDKHQQSFKINHVLMKDGGDYQCGTSTSDLSPPVTLKASTGILILQRPPVIYEGDPLTLRCHNIFGFIGTNTTFYKEDKEIKFSVSDSELHIDAVDGGASGMYTCTKLLRHPSDTEYLDHSAETFISLMGRSRDYTRQNIIRLVLCACIVIAAAGMIVYHLQGQRWTD